MDEEAQTPPAPAAPDAPPPAAAPSPAPTEPEVDWATRYKYLLAEFENYRRRAEREREGARDIARAELLRSLLPVYEASERAQEAVAQLSPVDPVRKGVYLLAGTWRAFLDSQKIAAVARAGALFESAWHEAVGEAPASEDRPAGAIVEVVQQGYRMGAQLLRPAKVIVARTAPEPEDAGVIAEAEGDPSAGDL